MSWKTIYINMKTPTGKIETVDEFSNNTLSDKKYAKKMLNEYQISDTYNTYYLSRKACNSWIYK